MLEIISFAAITALCSILHGKGDTNPAGGKFWEGKGFIMALHAVLAFALVHPLAPLLVPVYWKFFRGSKQARPELDWLMRKSPLSAIRSAYPLGLGRIIAPAIASRKSRREQEYISGLILGAICYIPIAVYLW